MSVSRLTHLITIERILYAALFLFPVFGMLIRGWLTNLFNILVLLGIFYLFRRKRVLLREEKVFLWLCAIYVGLFVLSAVVNGWGYAQTRNFGVELRFLFVIPVYLLVREHDECWKWLLYGCLAAITVIFIQSLYEVIVKNNLFANGVYSKNILGPFSILMGFWIIHLWWQRNSTVCMAIIILACIAAIASAVMSSSRGAYMAFFIMSGVMITMYFRPRWILLLSVLLATCSIVLYHKVDTIHDNVRIATGQFQAYFDQPDIVNVEGSLPSVMARLEMWRATKYFISDYPVFGVGPGNYQVKAKQYVAEGKVHKEVGEHSHPHNAYLEALISKGITGLCSLLLLLYYPMYLLIKTRKQSTGSASLGIVHLTGISVFAMFDASPILMNNYTSILLLGLAVFLSHHLNQTGLLTKQQLDGSGRQ